MGVGGGHHIVAWPWGAKPLFSFNVLSAAFILPPRISSELEGLFLVSGDGKRTK